MFSEFSRQDFQNVAKLKGSATKKLVAELTEKYSEAATEALFAEKDGKKAPAELSVAKCKNRAQLLLVTRGKLQVPIFWAPREGKWLPTLRVLQACPGILPLVKVDAGACGPILKGAEVMAPGISSIEDVAHGAPVLPSYSQGCDLRDAFVAVSWSATETPLAIGRLAQPADALLKPGRHGVAVEVLTLLGDGLWNVTDA